MPLHKLKSDAAIELSEIQGDVLIGLQKNVEAFLLLDIIDVPAFKRDLEAQLLSITYSDEVAAREAELLDSKATGQVAPSFVGSNLLFSKGGLAKLTDTGDIDFGIAFSREVEEREALLKDPVSRRLPAFERDADVIVLVTAVDEASLTPAVDAWRQAFQSSTDVRHSEIGRVRPGVEKGHEHFGFLDGVSQPGIDGLTEPAQHAPGSPAGDPTQGLPGQDLIKPGAFVLGYENEDGTTPELPAEWMRNGSYMVLRRLEQEVASFNSFLAAAAPAGGETVEKLGARLVGRWKSGAPIIIATDADDPALAKDKFANNDFDFNEDSHQAKCPFLGHIRKSYPRDDLDFTSSFPGKGEGEAFAEQHRIIRAGIPFGFEIGHDPDHGPTEGVGNEASRGLMFVSYQSSIEDGFEFIQTKWCNDPDFVFEKRVKADGPITVPGIDLIIGQTSAGPRSGDMSTDVIDQVIRNVPAFVFPTGTTYFFSPSRSALRDVLAA